nr:hypothetical protein [Tanacetum cinerariifolium]
MINSIKNGDQPLPRVTQVSIAETTSTEQPPLKDKSMWSNQEKRVQKIDRLARSLLTQGLSNDIYSLINSNKTAKDLWDALARHMLGSEYGEQDIKAVVFKEKVVVSSDSKRSKADDFSELKKISALLAKAFNRRKFHSKPTNNNLRTSSTSHSANKKQEFVKSNDKKVEKKADEKKRDMSRVKCYNYKEGHFAKDCKKAKVAQIEKVLSNSEASSSFADEKISEVSYYLSESESESEFETSKYYDNSTNYGLFVNNDDDQEIFNYAIESAGENFIKNHINSHKDYDKSDVDHNDYEVKDHLVDKLIRKFNKKIVKCQNRVEKANQQSKDFENQNKDLQDKYDILKNQTTTFEMNNKELNQQLKELIEKNNDLLAQTKVLKDQLQVKYVVIDTHVECQEKYAKLEAERYEYMIRYFAYFDNDKQHKKQIADQLVLYDKMSVQLVELYKHVRDLKNTVLEKDFKISELEECVRNKDLEIEKCLERLNVCENKLHKIGVVDARDPSRSLSSSHTPNASSILSSSKFIFNATHAPPLNSYRPKCHG